MGHSKYYQDSPKQSKPQVERTLSVEEREEKVKELFAAMEEEVKEVRRKYMAQIRSVYGDGDGKEASKENKAWNSPVKKLRQKNKDANNKESKAVLESKMMF
jgi:hypothetical protein